MKTKALTLLALCIGLSSSQADVVVTNDGARLTGKITLIDKGTIHLDTAYAGTLKIKQSEVKTLESDTPTVVRLESGSVMSGKIQSTPSGTLKIQSTDGVLETKTTQVAALWAPDSVDPEVKRNERKWKYNASLDLNGKTGNVEKFRIGTSLEATLAGPNDALGFYFGYEKADEEGNTTEDRTVGGGYYESFFSDIFGWYLRTELENDEIDGIDLRSTSGAGLSYRLIKKDYQSLVARTGVGYRYTSFSSGIDDESSATLDFGLAHSYTFNENVKMENDLTYVPSIEDFSNYLIVHDSGLVFPIGSSKSWKVRMGVRNEYDSESTNDRKLDTSYYTKMVYSWF